MLRDKKFLVIDDSNVFLSVLKGMLNEAGVTNNFITSTTDSDKAIHLLVKNQYDIVICDYNMNHHIDGGLIFDEIQTRSLLAYDGVFMCITGDNSVRVFTHFVELEPDDYLVKPITFRTFHSRLLKVVARKKVLAKLLELVGRKKYTEALAACTDLKKMHPEYNSYILRLEGDCLLRLKRYHSAKLLYQKASLETTHVWPKIGFANALRESGDIKEAEEIFESILVKQPRNPIAKRHLAQCMMRRDAIPEALQQFEALLKVNPANPMRELTIANLYMSLGHYDKASLSYEKFINKVNGTSKYTYSVAVFVPFSLLLAKSLTENKIDQTEIIYEAQVHLAKLKRASEQQEVKSIDDLNALTATFGVLAGSTPKFSDCFHLAKKIVLDEIHSFYTAIIAIHLYALCGMTEQYKQVMLRASKLSRKYDDEVVQLSKLKLLNGFSRAIDTRLARSETLINRAMECREQNRSTKAFSYAYKAYFIAPFHSRLCFLILELLALATPSGLERKEVFNMLDSCLWVCKNDNKISYSESYEAEKHYSAACNRINKGCKDKIA